MRTGHGRHDVTVGLGGPSPGAVHPRDPSLPEGVAGAVPAGAASERAGRTKRRWTAWRASRHGLAEAAAVRGRRGRDDRSEVLTEGGGRPEAAVARDLVDP